VKVGVNVKRYSKKILMVCLLCISGITTALGQQVTLSDTGSASSSGNAYIPQGILLDAELITGVGSATNAVGDIAYFKVKQSISIDGVVVLPSGSIGNAIVTKVKEAGFFGIGGGIELTINSVNTPNGISIPLTLDIKKYSKSNEKVIQDIVIYAVVIGSRTLGTYAAAMHGENQEIPAGTKFKVAVDCDVDLGCTPDRLAAVMIVVH
jgi:hypothetical protein